MLRFGALFGIILAIENKIIMPIGEYLIFYSSYIVFPLLFLIIYYFNQINKFAGIALTIIFLIFIYARFVEPYILKIKHFKIRNKKIKKEVRVAIIADAHLGIFNNGFILKIAINKINKIKPDIVLIAGDLTDCLSKKKIVHNLKILKKIEIPTYVVMGNHDHGLSGRDNTKEITEYLSKAGLNVIDNKKIQINIKNDLINIIGIGDYWAKKHNYSLLNQINNKDFTLVLMHNPDGVYFFKERRADLIICGHTHGGQIRIPFLYKYFIPTQHNFDKEFYKIHDMDLFISPGIGLVSLPFRFLMPPELDILEIN